MTQFASDNGTVRNDAPAAGDFGLVVRILGAVVASFASEGLTGAAVPASAIQVGFADAGGLLRAGRVYDTDTGGGTEFTVGSNIRISGAGGSIEAKGQQTMANSLPVVVASDQSAIPVTLTSAAVGAEGNAWAAAAVGAGGTSASIDCLGVDAISCFGTTNAITVITVELSQDNAAFYDSVSTNIPALGGEFGLNLTIGARYVRLRSSGAATITATIAGKA